MLKKQLKNWFIIHFVLDILFALPLFFSPRYFLELMGWTYYDPLTAKLLAAALFAIGIESWLSRNAELNSFKHLLNLKIIWSFFAVLGIGLLMLDAPVFYPMLLLVFLVFLFFNAIWINFRVKINKYKK
jgi:hypothetical protein